MARTLTVVAVGLIVLGAMTMTGPTFGFSTVASDRGVSVNTANDPGDALVGLNAAENVVIDGQNDPQTVVELENNLPNEATYTFDATIPAGLTVSEDESDINLGDELTLNPEDDPVEFVLECDGSSGESSESAWTSLTVEEAEAGLVNVRGAAEGTELEYECPGQSNDADIEVTNVESADNRHVTFNIENTGESDFRINEFAVDHDNSEEMSEIGVDDASESPQGNENWYTNGESIAVGGGNSGLANIDEGETVSVQIEFDVEMDGESFEFTILDARGSGGEETVMVDVP